MAPSSSMMWAAEPGGSETGYSSYVLKQLGETFRDKVAKLPAKQEVSRLHHFNGLQFTDLAEGIGITKGRMSQLHKEGLVQLRGC